MTIGERGGILVTGATGLVGGATLERLLGRHDGLHAYVLVRDLPRWHRAAAALALPEGRVTPLAGDVTASGLGLSAAARALLARRVRAVVHAAADTCFSRALPEARRVNLEGTRHVLELAEAWRVERFAYVSTAFVAGTTLGRVAEGPVDPPGWINAYERSKHEAETLVRAAGVPWSIFRSSTIACEDEGGTVRQINALHRSLRLHWQGLASLLPGAEDTPVDLVTNAYVSGAIAELALSQHAPGRTYHLCAGAAALPLGELLDRSQAFWRESEGWRRRGIARPALATQETYALFERTIEETGDPHLRRITRSLSHFVPQLALPKRFETTETDAALGRTAPSTRAWWREMLVHLRDAHWSARTRATGQAA